MLQRSDLLDSLNTVESSLAVIWIACNCALVMKPLIFALWALHGADAITTDVAISKGGYEVTAPVKVAWQPNTLDVAEAAYEHWFTNWLERNHHERWATGLRWAAVGGQAIAVGLNARAIHHSR